MNIRKILPAALLIAALAACSQGTPEPTTIEPTATQEAQELPTEPEEVAPEPTEETAEPAGSRQNPLSLGESRLLASNSMFSVGISEVNAEYRGAEWDEPVPDGYAYVNATVVVTFDSANAQAQNFDVSEQGIDPWMQLEFEVVSPDGKSYHTFDTNYCTGLNPLYDQGTVYSIDATVTGDVCIAVPTDAISGSVWRISNFINDAVWVDPSM